MFLNVTRRKAPGCTVPLEGWQRREAEVLFFDLKSPQRQVIPAFLERHLLPAGVVSKKYPHFAL